MSFLCLIVLVCVAAVLARTPFKKSFFNLNGTFPGYIKYSTLRSKYK